MQEEQEKVVEEKIVEEEQVEEKIVEETPPPAAPTETHDPADGVASPGGETGTDEPTPVTPTPPTQPSEDS